MTQLQEQIIKEYETLQMTHPSYGDIAKKLNCAKTYVFRTVSEHLAKAKVEKRKKKSLKVGH